MTNTLNGPKLGALCKTTSWDQNIGIQKKKWKLKTKTKFAKCGFFSKSWRYIKSLFWISWNIKMHHLTLDVQHGNPCHVEVDPLDRLLQRQLRHELWRKCCCCWKLVVLPDGRSWWFASWNNSGSQPSHSCDIIFFLQGISFASYGKFSHVYLYNSSIESYYIHILDVDISSYATSTNIIFRIYLNLYTYHLTWKRSKPPTSSFRSEPPKSPRFGGCRVDRSRVFGKETAGSFVISEVRGLPTWRCGSNGSGFGSGRISNNRRVHGDNEWSWVEFLCVCVCVWPGVGENTAAGWKVAVFRKVWKVWGSKKPFRKVDAKIQKLWNFNFAQQDLTATPSYDDEFDHQVSKRCRCQLQIVPLSSTQILKQSHVLQDVMLGPVEMCFLYKDVQ